MADMGSYDSVSIATSQRVSSASIENITAGKSIAELSVATPALVVIDFGQKNLLGGSAKSCQLQEGTASIP